MPQGMGNLFKLASPAITMFFYRKYPAIYFNNVARDEAILQKKFVKILLNKGSRQIGFKFCDEIGENHFPIKSWGNNSRIVLIPVEFLKKMDIIPNRKRAFILHRHGSRFSDTPVFFVNC